MGSLFGSNKGVEEATRQASAQAAATAQETERKRQAAETAQREMETVFKANQAADLRGESKATVVAGGTAEALGVGDEAARKKRTGTGGLASTLGVNL